MTTQDKNLDREGGENKALFEQVRERIANEVAALDLSPSEGEELALLKLWEAGRAQPQAGAAVPSDLTDAQITAGSNVLCDCSEPKRIGRNAAIDVFEAMTKATSATADTGTKQADWHECERIAELYAVNEALQNFAHDATGDNGTCVVRAVLEAVSGKTVPADTGVSGAGQSIDSPEFRELLAQLLDAAEKAEKANDPMQYKPARDRFIAHIDAQLARQREETDAARVESEQLKAYRASDRAYIEELEAAARQRPDSKPTDLSKRLRELADTYSEHAAISVLRRTVIAAADEIERLAAAQGEVVGEVMAKPDNEHGTLTWPRVVWKGGLFAMPPVGTKLYTAHPAAQGEPVAVDGVRWDLFPGYLIDHHEGDPISEEAIQGWVSDMLRDPQYLVAAAAQAVPGDEVRDFNAWVAPLLRFTEQMARQNGEPYFKKLAKRALDHYREQSATKTEGEE